MTQDTSELTLKAQHTRQHIFETALSLFITNGYEATTMRDIAEAADCSLGLTYRYFARKEELVLGLYRQMASETGAQIEKLPPGSIAERFYWLMSARLEQALRYRDLFRVVFGATMNPGSGVNILGPHAAAMRKAIEQPFRELVSRAADAPPKGGVEDLATLLYSAHFGILLFWLYDRTPNQRATAELLLLLRDLMALGRRFLALPYTRHGVARAARIAESLFNG